MTMFFAKGNIAALPPEAYLLEDAYTYKLVNQKRKQESLLARWLLQGLLLQQMGKTLQQCGFCKDEKGRPFLSKLPAFQVSIAHSEGEVWVALANFPLGIDLELFEPQHAADLQIAFSPQEWAVLSGSPENIFLAFAAKEALAKLHGTGFLTEPNEIELHQAVVMSGFCNLLGKIFVYTLALENRVGGMDLEQELLRFWEEE